MYSSKAWCDLWHRPSVLNILITINTTRIILWNFLEICHFYYMAWSRWIKILTFLLHISLISAMFSYVIVLVSWIVIVDIFHKNLPRFKKGEGRLDSCKEAVFVKYNTASCFAWCLPKISTIFMVWKISSCVLTYLNNTTFMHQRINWFCCGYEQILSKKLILGICCSSEWNSWWQFRKSEGTIFFELCGNPVITSIIMCGMK